MKKIVALVLSLIVCFSLLGTQICYAAGWTLVKKDADTKSGDEGKTESKETLETDVSQDIAYSSDVETQQTVKALREQKKKNALVEQSEEIDSVDTLSGDGNELGLTSKSFVLMEASTGEILLQRDKDLKMEPASITKIMTLILIFEALDAGKIKLTDTVTVSDHAASMGGSQVYLEPNETQTVETMIKCISIASANDACVAMSEFIAGSEPEFVARMNAKAKELGMKNTTFENCCGLDDSTTNHMSTAYDVALMSRELITKHPQISKYATTWMDTFTHVTKKGESEFGLTNTNKLVRSYNGITGLKTGSTSKAKYCLSATAKRNGMDLIAVVMCAPEPKTRFKEAAALLDFGFANTSIYSDDHKNLMLDPLPVENGASEHVEIAPAKPFSYVCLKGKDPSTIKREVLIKENVKAPVKQGAELGMILYKIDNQEIGRVPIIAKQEVREMTYKDCFIRLVKRYFLVH